jgi:glycosyltransferase involved in cell wall biosynthesis
MPAPAAPKVVFIHSNADYLVGLRLPLMREISRRGYLVTAIAPNIAENHRRILSGFGIASERCDMAPTGMNPLADLAHTLRLTWQLRRLRPDVVLTNTIKPVIFGTIAAKFAGVRRRYAMVSGLGYAFTESGTLGMRKRISRWIASLLYWLAFRLNRVVVFQNSDDAQEMREAGICPGTRAAVVGGSGVDLQEFSFSERSGAPAFVMVGRLLVEKGARDFLEAARRLKRDAPRSSVLLVGDADGNPSALREDELAAFEREGVAEVVKGARDVRPFLYRSSIFVLPSYREGVPRSTLEAMASGMAVITTDVPGCRETVRNGENGLIVPVRDPDALASAMLELASDPERVRRMGAMSRKMAEEKFCVKKINDLMCVLVELPALEARA